MPYLDLTAVVATAQDGTTGAENLKDTTTTTIWSSSSVPAWVQYDLGSAIEVRYYRMGFPGGGGDWPYAPSAWTLEGSADATTWVVLDTRTGQDVRYADVALNVRTPGAYRYYRLSMSAQYDSYSGVGLRLGGWGLGVDEWIVNEVLLSASPLAGDALMAPVLDAVARQRADQSGTPEFYFHVEHVEGRWNVYSKERPYSGVAGPWTAPVLHTAGAYTARVNMRFSTQTGTVYSETATINVATTDAYAANDTPQAAIDLGVGAVAGTSECITHARKSLPSPTTAQVPDGWDDTEPITMYEYDLDYYHTLFWRWRSGPTPEAATFDSIDTMVPSRLRADPFSVLDEWDTVLVVFLRNADGTAGAVVAASDDIGVAWTDTARPDGAYWSRVTFTPDPDTDYLISIMGEPPTWGGTARLNYSTGTPPPTEEPPGNAHDVLATAGEDYLDVSVDLEARAVVDVLVADPPVTAPPLPDPTVAPTLTGAPGGILPAGTYAYTYAWYSVDPSASTLLSPEASITLAADGSVQIDFPDHPDAGGASVWRRDPGQPNFRRIGWT